MIYKNRNQKNKFVIGKKLRMTQVYNDQNIIEPVTVIETTPSVVTLVKTESGKDGYNSIQYGFGEKKVKNINKPEKGHLKDLGNFAVIKEFRAKEVSGVNVGDKVDCSVFSVGDLVEVTAISKGKGFQGVVKRHGFKGGPRSHGQKHSEREPGSIGGGGRDGGRVAKGMRMAGRMGGDRVTVKNLKVVAIDTENSRIYLRGAVPGRNGSIVEIKA